MLQIITLEIIMKLLYKQQEVTLSEGFLPLTRQDMLDRGLDQLDFVYIIGDAYVDHPSFGHAIISRILESHGYTVGLSLIHI